MVNEDIRVQQNTDHTVKTIRLYQHHITLGKMETGFQL